METVFYQSHLTDQVSKHSRTVELRSDFVVARRGDPELASANERVAGTQPGRNLA